MLGHTVSQTHTHTHTHTHLLPQTHHDPEKSLQHTRAHNGSWLHLHFTLLCHTHTHTDTHTLFTYTTHAPVATITTVATNTILSRALHCNVVSLFMWQPGWLDDSIINLVSPFTETPSHTHTQTHTHTHSLICITGVNYTNGGHKVVSALYSHSLSLTHMWRAVVEERVRSLTNVKEPLLQWENIVVLNLEWWILICITLLAKWSQHMLLHCNNLQVTRIQYSFFISVIIRFSVLVISYIHWVTEPTADSPLTQNNFKYSNLKIRMVFECQHLAVFCCTVNIDASQKRWTANCC